MIDYEKGKDSYDWIVNTTSIDNVYSFCKCYPIFHSNTQILW